MPVLLQCLLGGTALWPDSTVAAVDESIPFLTLGQCRLPEAVLPRRFLAQEKAGRPFGGVTWKKEQLEMPK